MPHMDLGARIRESKLYERRAAITAYRWLRRLAGRVGVDFLVRTFYSPIPALDQLPSDIFDRRASLTGVTWDTAEQLNFLKADLGAFVAEFAAQPESIAHPYTTRNPSYGVLDAAVLYAMVRATRPARVLELGSGFSSMVMASAVRHNAQHGSPGSLSVKDPFANQVLDRLPGVAHLERVTAQNVPLDEFESLRANDILFIDTTHTVKLGSDVNYIVLEVLPRLAVGVIVHIHDIFIPYEYPRAWPEDFALYWNEQYLVHAFLAMNPSYRVLLGLGGLCRGERDSLAKAVPDLAAYDASGLWIRRVER